MECPRKNCQGDLKKSNFDGIGLLLSLIGLHQWHCEICKYTRLQREKDTYHPYGKDPLTWSSDQV